MSDRNNEENSVSVSIMVELVFAVLATVIVLALEFTLAHHLTGGQSFTGLGPTPITWWKPMSFCMMFINWGAIGAWGYACQGHPGSRFGDILNTFLLVASAIVPVSLTASWLIRTYLEHF